MKNRRLKIFTAALFISLPLWWIFNELQKNLEDFFLANISVPVNKVVIHEVQKPEISINAQSAISVKLDMNGTAKTVFEQNSEEILPIASLSKLMTAVVVLDNPAYFNFNDIIIISKRAANQDNAAPFGSLTEGETYTLGKLFEMMLVYSSNDAAFAFSEKMGVENFVSEMNKKATEIGMTNTHFANPAGLDPITVNNLQFSENPGNFNYSTARDMAKLAEYIFKNYPEIFEHSLNPNTHYSFENGISLVQLPSGYQIVGGKTGYTDTALGCIAYAFKNRRGECFFNVILRAESKETRISEMQNLVNWLSL